MDGNMDGAKNQITGEGKHLKCMFIDTLSPVYTVSVKPSVSKYVKVIQTHPKRLTAVIIISHVLHTQTAV